jgi:hypothetical protein
VIHRARAVLLSLVVLGSILPATTTASAMPAAVTAARSPFAAGAAANTPARTATPVPYATTLTEAVAPGVVHRHGTWTTSAGSQTVEFIDVAAAPAGIRLEASYAAGGLSTLQRMSGQAAHVSMDGHRVVAAVNGDTWTQDAVGQSAPTGLLVHAAELISASRSARPTIGFDPFGAAITGDVGVTTTLTLPDGFTTLTVDRINKPRNAGELDLYTERWGLSTGTRSDGTEVTLFAPGLPLTTSGAWTATVMAVAPSGGDSGIPSSGLVLSAQGADAAALATLAVGQTVTLTTSVPYPWASVWEAVSGREWLVRDGVAGVSPVSSTTAGTHPRTAVGVRVDGSLLLTTVDGRLRGESSGVTADDLAALLVGQGVVNAINLDGGGSTTALARRPGDVGATVVNTPSDGTERRVADGLLVVSSFPTGPVTRLAVRPGDPAVVVGQLIAFTAGGTDDALNGVPLPGLPIAWSIAGFGATLTPAGVLTTQAPGLVTVSATSGGLFGSSTVSVLPDTIAPTATAPVMRLRSGPTVSPDGESVSVSWPAATDIGTGVAQYEVERQMAGGVWTPVALATPLARSFVEQVVPALAVQYRVRAVDAAGNAGAWRAAGPLQILQADETAASYAGLWVRRNGDDYLGGLLRASRGRGATATFTFSGSQVAWYAARGPTFGSATILLDGAAVATVSLQAARLQPARVVYVHAWPTAGRHRIAIRVVATPGHPWVGVDGFGVVGAAGP